MAQQLLKEEGIARGASDTALGQGRIDNKERLGQRPRRGLIERAEIDREEAPSRPDQR